MTEKGVAVLAVLVMLLLGTAHAVYGYWTDRIGVKEEIAVIWPVEVEIEEETEETEETVSSGNETTEKMEESMVYETGKSTDREQGNEQRQTD